VSQLSSLSLVTNLFYCTIMLMWEHNTNGSWLSLKCLVWTNYHPLKTPSLTWPYLLCRLLESKPQSVKRIKTGRLFFGWNF
jgi:hypothetical protein